MEGLGPCGDLEWGPAHCHSEPAVPCRRSTCEAAGVACPGAIDPPGALCSIVAASCVQPSAPLLAVRRRLVIAQAGADAARRSLAGSEQTGSDFAPRSGGGGGGRGRLRSQGNGAHDRSEGGTTVQVSRHTWAGLAVVAGVATVGCIMLRATKRCICKGKGRAEACSTEEEREAIVTSTSSDRLGQLLGWF